MKDINAMGMSQEASLVSNKKTSANLGMIDYFEVECYDADGNFKWKETIKNLVTNEGLEHVLDVVFKNGTNYTSWYVGLKNDDGTPLGTDAAGQLPGGTMNWTEHENYTDTNNSDNATTRPVMNVTAGITGTTTKELSNSGNVAIFKLTSPANDVGGVFVTDGITKGSASGANILYGVGNFAAAKTGLEVNDSLNVTVTFQATSGA
jgi:hypothetical protein